LGIIEIGHKKDVQLLVLADQRKLHVTNWRLLFVLEGEKLIVTLSNLNQFCIHDITLDYFLQTNQHQWTIKRPYRYISNMLVCPHCWGPGKLDWVERARGKSEPNWSDYKRFKAGYRRDVNVLNRLNVDVISNASVGHEYNIIDAYSSQPKVYDGQVLCKCRGTGINSLTIDRKDLFLDNPREVV